MTEERDENICRIYVRANETKSASGVASVNGKTGEVILKTDDISDQGQMNKYVTEYEKQTWDGKSTVSVEPILSTGTKIASMEVDGTSLDLYAPTGGGSSTLTADLTASVSVGGIESGTTYQLGTSLEDILRDLLDPLQYPTLTDPSATLSSAGTKLLEAGSTASRTLVLELNRGSINPAYGTDGYRSGLATGYSLNGGTAVNTGTFTETVSETNNEFQGTVAYAAGPQPKDSKGHDYNSPLPAGSATSNKITYEFVNAIWANTANITTVAKLALVSFTTGVKEFNFPAQTASNAEQFDIPASWHVTAVEVLNTLSNTWEDCSSEFTVGTTTHLNAANQNVNYATYTDNRGYAAAARKVRVKWSGTN